MVARELNEIDRQLAGVRQQIKEQKAVIHRFEQEHQIADAIQAGVLLKVLEDELSHLLERRLYVLGRLRRPRATSNAIECAPQRKSISRVRERIA
jgi:hypothetical protein